MRVECSRVGWLVVKEGSAPGGEQKRAAQRRKNRRQITSDGEQRWAGGRAAKKSGGGGDVRVRERCRVEEETKRQGRGRRVRSGGLVR